jgi:hypothetical protein
MSLSSLRSTPSAIRSPHRTPGGGGGDGAYGSTQVSTNLHLRAALDDSAVYNLATSCKVCRCVVTRHVTAILLRNGPHNAENMALQAQWHSKSSLILLTRRLRSSLAQPMEAACIQHFARWTMRTNSRPNVRACALHMHPLLNIVTSIKLKRSRR